MPRPARRSRSLARVKRVTPGGLHKIHYVRRRPSLAKCAVCKKPLSGVPRERPTAIQALPKSKMRPNRPFGGNLCSRCTRERIKELKLYKRGVK